MLNSHCSDHILMLKKNIFLKAEYLCAVSALVALAFQMTPDVTFSLSKSNSHYNLPSRCLHRMNLQTAPHHTSYLHIAIATSLLRFQALRLSMIYLRIAFAAAHTPAVLTKQYSMTPRTNNNHLLKVV